MHHTRGVSCRFLQQPSPRICCTHQVVPFSLSKSCAIVLRMNHTFTMSGIVLNEESLHPSQFLVVAGVVPGKFRRVCVCGICHICLGLIHTSGSPAHSSNMQIGDLILLIDNYRCVSLPNIALCPIMMMVLMMRKYPALCVNHSLPLLLLRSTRYPLQPLQQFQTSVRPPLCFPLPS